MITITVIIMQKKVLMKEDKVINNTELVISVIVSSYNVYLPFLLFLSWSFDSDITH